MKRAEKRYWLRAPTLMKYRNVIEIKSIKIDEKESYVIFVDTITKIPTVHKRTLVYKEKNSYPYFKLDNHHICLKDLIGKED